MASVPQLYMWRDRVLYLGPSFDPVMHKHHAVQICIGIDAPFSIALGENNDWQSARAALVSSETAHQIISQHTAMAFLYLESETADYQALLHLSGDAESGVLKIDIDKPLLTALALASGGGSALEAYELCNRMLSIFGIRLSEKIRLDPRISRVLQKLDETQDGQCDSKVLEAITCLSSSRLQHLFREQVGIPIRRYSLWLRLRRVLGQAIEGKTLMDAAHAAGFSDSAHFSRVFKGMFGITPSLLFSAGSLVKLHLLSVE